MGGMSGGYSNPFQAFMPQSQPTYGGGGRFNQMAWGGSSLNQENPYSSPQMQPRQAWYGGSSYGGGGNSYGGSYGYGGGGGFNGGPLPSTSSSPFSNPYSMPPNQSPYMGGHSGGRPALSRSYR